MQLGFLKLFTRSHLERLAVFLTHTRYEPIPALRRLRTVQSCRSEHDRVLRKLLCWSRALPSRSL
jgi:hypothetical protein